MGSPWEDANNVIDCAIQDVLWVRELEQLARMSNGVYSEGAKKEALWRTPIADRGMPGMTYIWYTRAATEALGHSVLMGTFSFDGVDERHKGFWYEKSRAYQKILRSYGKDRRFFFTHQGYLIRAWARLGAAR